MPMFSFISSPFGADSYVSTLTNGKGDSSKCSALHLATNDQVRRPGCFQAMRMKWGGRVLGEWWLGKEGG